MRLSYIIMLYALQKLTPVTHKVIQVYIDHNVKRKQI